MTTNENIADALEQMIDKHGLLAVVTALDLICSEKADHIEVNWQDKITAKPWRRASNALYTASRKVESLSI